MWLSNKLLVLSAACWLADSAVIYSHCGPEVDVVVVADVSIADTERQTAVREQLSKIAESMPITAARFRTALIAYGERFSVDLSLARGDAQLFEQAADAVEFSDAPQQSNTAAAVSQAIVEMDKFGREGAVRLLLLLTDDMEVANSPSQVAAVAERLRAVDNLKVLVMTVGDNRTDELVAYAEGADNVFTPDTVLPFWDAITAAVTSKLVVFCPEDEAAQPMRELEAPEPITVSGEKPSCTLDVMFVVDTAEGSASVFDKHKEAVMEIVQRSPQKKDAKFRVNLGVTAGSQPSGANVMLGLSNDDKLAAMDTVEELQMVKGEKSYIAVSMALALSALKSQPEEHQKLIVLLTDGVSDDPEELKKEIAQLVHAANIEVMLVTLSPIIRQSDVLDYATSLKHVFNQHDRLITRMQQKFQQIQNCARKLPKKRDNHGGGEPELYQSVLPSSGGCEVDILFIIDTSGSVESEYSKERAFAEQIASQFSDADYAGRVHVGAVSFSSRAVLVSPFGKYKSKDEVLKMIQGIEHTGGGTSAPSALQLALPELRRHRSQAITIVVHISDGNSREEIATEIEPLGRQLREAGATVFAATFSPQFYMPELVAITGSEKTVFVNQRAAELTTEVVRLANSDSCNAPLPPKPEIALSVDPCSFDVFVVLDTSGSVEDDYYKARDFVADTMGAMDTSYFSSGKVAVEVIRFDTNAEVAVDYQAARPRDELVAAIKAIEHTGGGTSALSGIRHVIRDIKKNRRQGDDTQVIVLLVSDGNSGQSDTLTLTTTAAKELADTGAVTYAATFSSDAYLPELTLYTGSADRVYSNARAAAIKDALIQLIGGSSSCGSPPPPPPPEPVGCDSGRPIDFMIILDESGSVSELFAQERQLAADIIKQMPANAINVRVAVATVRFSRTAAIEIPFSSGKSRDQMVAQLESLENKGGSTSAASGVRLAIQEIQRSRRPDAQLLVLHISDGNSQDTWEEAQAAAEQLKALNGQVYAATLSRDPILRELAIYAGSEERVYTAGRVTELRTKLGSILAGGGTGTGPGCGTPPPPPTPVDPTESGQCPIDLLFIIDTSGSVESEYSKERQLAIDVADRFLEGDYLKRLKVAAIGFHGEATVMHSFGAPAVSKATVLGMLGGIKHTGGSTSSAKALQLAIQEIQQNQRPDADLIVLHISDGNSVETIDRLATLASQVRDLGATVFTATVGQVCEVCRQELETIAGHEKRVYTDARAAEMTDELVNFANSDQCLAPEPDPAKCSFDLFVVLDVSGSVEDDFYKERDFVAELMQSLPAGALASGKVAAEVVQFHTSASVAVPFQLGRQQAQLVADVKAIKHVGGGTSALSGIEHVIGDIEKNRREDTEVVVVLVSDGNSGNTDTDDRTIPTAKLLHDIGVLTYSFSFSADYYYPELLLYAGSKDRVYVNGKSGQFKGDLLKLLEGGSDCPQVTAPPVVVPPTTTGCNVDLLIILDVSGSIVEEYVRQRQFAVDVVNAFSDGDLAGRVRVALVTFHRSSAVVARFGEQTSKQAIVGMIESTEHVGGSTSSPSGLRAAAQLIRESKRPDAQVFVVHISDGNSQDLIESVASAASELKATGAHVFVTTFSNDAYLPELNLIADAEHRIFLQDRASLLASTVASEAGGGEDCGAPPPPPPPPVTPTCGKLDLLIILDTSGSVADIFEKQRQVAIDLIKQIPSNQFDTRIVVAAVSFAASSVVEMEFNSQRTKDKVIELLQNIKQQFGSTSIANGARDAVRQIQSRRRSDAQTNVILISDGHSQDAWADVVLASESLQNTGATVYAVTVGTDYSQIELQAYTGAAERVYADARVSNFLSDMQRIIAESSCQAKRRRRRRAATRAIGGTATRAIGDRQDCEFVDLALVIDTSGSVQEEFLQQRRVAEDIIEGIPEEAFSSGRLAVSVVKFFSAARIEIPFEHPQDKADILRMIRGIDHTGGATSGVSGVRAGLRSLEHGHRREARAVFVLISDGNSQDPFDVTKATAVTLHQTGAAVYAATLSSNFYLPELEVYAGSKDNVYIGDRIPVMIQSVIGQVASKSCGVVNPPPTFIPAPVKKPCVGGLDLLIVLDKSGSIQKTFEEQRRFAGEVVESLSEAEVGASTSVALISFSEQTKVELRLNNGRRKQQVLDAIAQVEYTGGSTATSRAVQTAIRELESNARVGSRQVVLLINDGHSQDSWATVLATSEQLQATAALTYAVTFSPKPYLPELVLYAGETDRIFQRNNARSFISSLTALSRSATYDCEQPFTSAPQPVPVPVTPRPQPPPPPFPTDGCDQLDIVVILDASTSVTGVFEHQRELTLSLIERLPIAPDSAQIAMGIISYTTEAFLRVPMETGQSEEELRAAVLGIEHVGGSTRTARGVRLAIQHMQQRRRPNARQAFILMNDGFSQDLWQDVLTTSGSLESTGWERFVVGLGPKVYMEELDLYAGDRSAIYRSGQTIEFQDDVVKLISAGGGNCGPPPRPVTPAPPRPPPPSTGCAKNLDISVIVDTAGNKINFETSMGILLDLMGSLPLPPESDRARLQALIYSLGENVEVHSFVAQQFSQIVLRKLGSIEHSGGPPGSLADSVQKAITNWERNRRSDAIPVFFIVVNSESDSSNPAARQAAIQKLRNIGALVHVISFGQETLPRDITDFTQSGAHVFLRNDVMKFLIAIRQLVSTEGSCETTTAENYIFTTRVPRKLPAEPVTPKATRPPTTTTTTRRTTPRRTTTERTTTRRTTTRRTTTRRTTTRRTTTPRPTTTTTRKSTTPFIKGCEIDLMFVIDASGSVNKTFQASKKIAEELVRDHLRVGPNNAQVSMVRFAGPRKVYKDFSLNEYRSKDRIIEEIRKGRHISGTTDVRGALDFVAKDYIKANGARGKNAALPVVIIFTDGYSTYDHRAAAEKLRREVPTILAVGINRDQLPVNEAELEFIAGTPDNVYTNESLRQFYEHIDRLTDSCA